MPLLTARDREIRRLELEIQKVEAWLHVDAGDRRASAWHQAKLQELQAERDRLLDQP
jgi:hypothetical protein